MIGEKGLRRPTLLFVRYVPQWDSGPAIWLMIKYTSIFLYFSYIIFLEDTMGRGAGLIQDSDLPESGDQLWYMPSH